MSDFSDIFLLLIFSLILPWSESACYMISIYLTILRLFYGLGHDLPWWMFYVHLKLICIPLLWITRSLNVDLIQLVYSVAQFSSALQDFSVLSVTDKKVLKCPNTIVDFFFLISYCSSISYSLRFFEALFVGLYYFRIVIASWLICHIIFIEISLYLW